MSDVALALPPELRFIRQRNGRLHICPVGRDGLITATLCGRHLGGGRVWMNVSEQGVPWAEVCRYCRMLHLGHQGPPRETEGGEDGPGQ